MELWKWAGQQIRADEPVSARRSRNRVSGVFLGIGALLSFVTLILVPGWQVHHTTTVAIIAIVLVIAAASQVVFAATVPITMNHAATAIGTVAIAVTQALVADPGAVATLGLMYVWISICAALYYSPFATAIHVVDVVIAQVIVLIVLFRAALVPQVILTAGTTVTVAIVVSMLVRNMRRQTLTDPLTKLLNRRGLNRAFDTEIAIATRTGQPLAIAIIDLDDFKRLNDEHGHAAGDAALVDAAEAWTHALQPGDILARLGGDEFAVVLPGSGVVEAKVITRALMDATPHGIGCSVGIAVHDGREDRHALLARADEALYVVKSRGGRDVAVGDPPQMRVA